MAAKTVKIPDPTSIPCPSCRAGVGPCLNMATNEVRDTPHDARIVTAYRQRVTG